MAFIDIPPPKRGGRPGGNTSTESRMTVVKHSEMMGGFSLQLSISISAMQHMRWLIGDAVQVSLDDKVQTDVLIRRVKNGGRVLSSSKGRKSLGASNERGIVKFALPKNLPFVYGDSFCCTEYKEGHGGLLLSFSRQTRVGQS